MPYILNHNFSGIIFYKIGQQFLASIFSKVGCGAFSRVDFCARPWRIFDENDHVDDDGPSSSSSLCYGFLTLLLLLFDIEFSPISLKGSDQKIKSLNNRRKLC